MIPGLFKPGEGSLKPVRIHRRGLISVAVLIALIIVAILCGAMLKVGLARRAEVASRERRIQADWLVEAGLDRALARLGSSLDYPGETWTVLAEDLGGRGSGLITIQVQPVSEKPGSRRIHVSAEYPGGTTYRAKRSREFVIDHLKPSEVTPR